MPAKLISCIKLCRKSFNCKKTLRKLSDFQPSEEINWTNKQADDWTEGSCKSH